MHILKKVEKVRSTKQVLGLTWCWIYCNKIQALSLIYTSDKTVSGYALDSTDHLGCPKMAGISIVN